MGQSHFAEKETEAQDGEAPRPKSPRNSIKKQRETRSLLAPAPRFQPPAAQAPVPGRYGGAEVGSHLGEANQGLRNPLPARPAQPILADATDSLTTGSLFTPSSESPKTQDRMTTPSLFCFPKPWLGCIGVQEALSPSTSVDVSLTASLQGALRKPWGPAVAEELPTQARGHGLASALEHTERSRLRVALCGL